MQETKETSEERTEKLDADEQNGVKKEADQLIWPTCFHWKRFPIVLWKEAGGGQATDWDLDKEMNVTYWEVKVEDGNKKTNVKKSMRKQEKF